MNKITDEERKFVQNYVTVNPEGLRSYNAETAVWTTMEGAIETAEGMWKKLDRAGYGDKKPKEAHPFSGKPLRLFRQYGKTYVDKELKDIVERFIRDSEYVSVTKDDVKPTKAETNNFVSRHALCKHPITQTNIGLVDGGLYCVACGVDINSTDFTDDGLHNGHSVEYWELNTKGLKAASASSLKVRLFNNRGAVKKSEAALASAKRRDANKNNGGE